MAAPDSRKWLDTGIAAVRSGDKETARAMLMKVVEVDERNEQAWLWLSVVAETEEEKRICLENVLALNPGSRVAQKGLSHLDDLALNSSEFTVANPSTSLLHGDTPTSLSRPSQDHASVGRLPTEFKETNRRDVWDSDEDICAYCAAAVSQEDRRCPNCHRSLIRREFRYPASAVLHVFWVFLFSLALILGLQAMLKYRFERRTTDAIFHALLAGLLMLSVVGVIMRLFVAHLVSIFVLILATILGVYNFLVPFELAVAPVEFGDVALRGLTTGLLNRIGLLLETIHVVLAGATLFYAVLRAAPEFERIEERNVAGIEKGLQTAVDYHMVARRMKERGRWASAVLHWQRAAAIDPNKAVYQRDLARAYMHLGFQSRALNVLQTARKLPMQPSIQSDVERLYSWVQKQVTPSKEGRNTL